MKGSDLLVRCLENEGVDRIFGIPGEENLDVMDSLIDSNIEFVLTKHEESASFMAEVFAYLTNKPGVCLSTLGPGATNLITGVADAYLNNLPMIVLTGQTRTERAYHPQKQYIDLVDLYKPITKDSISVRSSTRIPVIIRNSFMTALQEKPGPVHLELPEDVMKSDADGMPLRKSMNIRCGGDEKSKEAALEAIRSSSAPLILAGRGVLRAEASKELVAFARSVNIPVVHTWMANGIMPFDDPLSLHSVGLRTHDFMRRAFELADLVITIGYDVLEFQPVFWNIGRAKKIVHISQSEAEISQKYSPDIQLIGDLQKTLEALTSEKIDKENWTAALRDQLHAKLSELTPDGGLVKPQTAIRLLRECLGREDIAVCDVGAHLLWMEKLYPVYAEKTLIASNGLLPMGFGVPAAIAAKLVYPQRKVVAVCGDGGFMMTAAELETALRLKTNFVTVIFNDGGYGIIRTRQQKNFGRTIGVDFKNPDFVKFAESFGAEGYRITTATDFKEILEKCLRSDATAVIDVPVDYGENKRLVD